MAQLAWQRKRQAVARWAWAGLASGALVGIVAFAPATWLAAAVARATNERLLLADARGTVWNGSAIAVLTGGPDSRSAAALPERLNWSIALRTSGLALSLNQSCCMSAPLVLQLRPGLGRLSVSLLPGAGSLGEWPAAWLTGLGAPWNTLQLGGTLRLASPGIGLHLGDGGWRLEGQATLELNNASSRVSTLDRLGSYSLVVDGKGANTANLLLRTLDGSLLVNGTGGWTDGRLRFRGEARAAPGFESALDNLLNILGRRQGALSVISIGSP
jgi:general secretion pathway protein N